MGSTGKNISVKWSNLDLWMILQRGNSSGWKTCTRSCCGEVLWPLLYRRLDSMITMVPSGLRISECDVRCQCWKESGPSRIQEDVAIYGNIVSAEQIPKHTLPKRSFTPVQWIGFCPWRDAGRDAQWAGRISSFSHVMAGLRTCCTRLIFGLGWKSN